MAPIPTAFLRRSTVENAQVEKCCSDADSDLAIKYLWLYAERPASPARQPGEGR
jgi:hypothetical protein